MSKMKLLRTLTPVLAAGALLLHPACAKKKELPPTPLEKIALSGRSATARGFVAVAGGEDFEAAKLYLEADFGIDSANEEGMTPLMAACRTSKYWMVSHLLSNGADINARDRAGATPLMHAIARKGNDSMVKLLILSGANINAKNNRGYTPLMIAAQTPDTEELIRLLLLKGASVNDVAEYGLTALIIASQNGASPAVISSLIAKGADINAKTYSGATALTLARKSGFKKVVRALEDSNKGA